MAAKKKSKKPTKPKRKPTKKAESPRRTAKKQTSTKLIVKKKKRISSSKRKKTSQRSRQKATRVYTHKEGATFEPEVAGLRTGGQSGDLQGLHDVQDVDSESVDELLEEGNAFEAGVVAGVEHVEDDAEQEVHTHEVPEDDVPEEYRDKDS